MDKEKKSHRGYTENSKLNTTDDSLEGRWSNIQADYRKKYPEIQNEDVDDGNNNFDDIVNRIARRTNRSREEVENDLKGWMK